MQKPESVYQALNIDRQSWMMQTRKLYPMWQHLSMVLEIQSTYLLVILGTLLTMLRGPDQIPAGFIVTGPNIASQALLFKQLSVRLKSDIDGPTVVLRSGDTSNLKAVLKQLIRDATNQKPNLDDEEEGLSFEHNVTDDLH